MATLSTTPLRLAEAGPPDAAVLARLWQLFRHDLSEFRDSWPGPDGLFPAHDLHTYLARDGDRVDYLLYTGERPTGFATVGGLKRQLRSLDTLFVIRRARRLGLGRRAALTILAHRPGTWEVGFQQSNTAAARFWREVAEIAAPSAWREKSRPVPGKPWIADDRFVIFDVPSGATPP